jgi:nucleoid-associated protein YgaU
MALMKAVIINTDALVPLTIPVMFNPPEYQLEKTNQFADIHIPGLGSSLLQFVQGNAETLTMDLFFDTTDSGEDVRTATELIVGFTAVNSETHAPPRLLFLWGSLAFPCILESVRQQFDFFDTQGRPLRARLTVTLKGYDTIESLLAAIPLLSADRTKRHVFVQGETLQAIAAAEYGDPRQWRPIAQASGIDNPLTIRPGQPLTIPVLKS